MSLFELRVEIPPSMVDGIDNLLLEFGRPNWSVFEDVIVRRAWVVGLGPDEAVLRREWGELVRGLAEMGGGTVGEPEIRTMADADWRDSYKAHFHAWQFGPLHWVPVWERESFRLPSGHAVLWLDPGLAFGTGNHETTRLCCERLVALATSPHSRPVSQRRVIDAGCGSGILALSAALLGFGSVAGFDNDPEAVRISEENAGLNALAGRVRFLPGDLVSGLAGQKADIVLANIQADVLIRFARELVSAVDRGGTLVLSGILAKENPGVCQAFATQKPGWAIDHREMGEWSDLVLTCPP